MQDSLQILVDHGPVPRVRVTGSRAGSEGILARSARPGAGVPLVVAHADAAGAVAVGLAAAVTAVEAGPGT